METKTSKAIELYRGGNFLASLRLFKDFRLGLSKEERDVIKTAYECLTGNESFYQMLGIDTASVIDQCKEIIETKLIKP